MTNYIKYEYLDFANYHKNKVNLVIHVLAGTIYMSSLNILSKFMLLPFYVLLLLLTFESQEVIFLSIIFIYLSTCVLYKYKLKPKYLLLIFLLNCFIVPEISHLLTGEIIVLNFNNLTLDKFITNITYFLPFSIKRLISVI